MVTLTIPKLGKRDFHTYMAHRFPHAKKRMSGYVIGEEFSGAIIRHSRGRVLVLPTVPSWFGIALCVLGVGILLWWINWSHDAWEIATETAERISDDFDVKMTIGA